jgi:hypothetical protein
MKPGVTIPPFASITRALVPFASFAISALDPTAVMRSPEIAIPLAHG